MNIMNIVWEVEKKSNKKYAFVYGKGQYGLLAGTGDPDTKLTKSKISLLYLHGRQLKRQNQGP